MSAGDLAGQPRPAPPWLRNRAPRCRRLSIVPAFLPWLPPDSEPGSPSPGWERIRALGDGPPPPAGALGQGPPTCSARLGSSPGASVLLASVSPLEKIEKSGGAHLAEPDEGSMGSHVQEAEHLCPQVRFQSTAQLGAVGSESAPVSGPEWISQEIVPPRPTSPPPPAPGKKWGETVGQLSQAGSCKRPGSGWSPCILALLLNGCVTLAKVSALCPSFPSLLV